MNTNYTPAQQATIAAKKKFAEKRAKKIAEYAAGQSGRILEKKEQDNKLATKYRDDSRLGVLTLAHCVKFPAYAHQTYLLLEAVDAGKSKQSIETLSE